MKQPLCSELKCGKQTKKKREFKPGMMAHAWKLSTQELNAGELRIWGQPEIHSETYPNTSLKKLQKFPIQTNKPSKTSNQNQTGKKPNSNKPTKKKNLWSFQFVVSTSHLSLIFCETFPTIVREIKVANVRS
jgi:hypothetical protein